MRTRTLRLARIVALALVAMALSGGAAFAHPPTIECPPPVCEIAGPDGTATVTLTATVDDRVTAADRAEALRVTFTVDGTLRQTTTVPGGRTGPVNVPFTYTYSLGTHTVKICVKDPVFAEVCCETTVEVDTPRRIECEVTLPTLRQNNHNLVDVGLRATLTGGCLPDEEITLTSANVTVCSDEDDVDPTIGGGQFQFSPDAKLTNGVLRLRQERQASGNGRVFLIVVRAEGLSCCTTVVVPFSQSPANIASIEAQRAAAEAFCESNEGACPPGFFLVGEPGAPVIGPKQ